MTDADGTMIARIQISPTLCQALNKTCRKCTCQCCCLCRVCDCIRCKCCVAKPDVRVLTPTFKEKVDIFYKAKCCGAPKTKIYYPTMYIPGQGDADEGKNEAADDPKDAATDDAPIEGGDGYQKYNKQTKGAKKGEPGEKQKYYLKKPKYATCGCIPDVGMKRDIAKCLGAGRPRRSAGTSPTSRPTRRTRPTRRAASSRGGRSRSTMSSISSTARTSRRRRRPARSSPCSGSTRRSSSSERARRRDYERLRRLSSLAPSRPLGIRTYHRETLESRHTPGVRVK